MAYTVVLRKLADNQLKYIKNYYSELSVQAAKTVLRKIKTGLTDIGQNPYCAQIYHKPYHRYVAGKYLIYYRFSDEARKVIVIAIIHGAQVTNETLAYLHSVDLKD